MDSELNETKVHGWRHALVQLHREITGVTAAARGDDPMKAAVETENAALQLLIARFDLLVVRSQLERAKVVEVKATDDRKRLEAILNA